MLLNWTLCKFSKLADSWDKKGKKMEETAKEMFTGGF
jgi:hypothetical protein